MVREALKPRREDAACCSVDVVNGGCGLRRVGLASTLSAVKAAPSSIVLIVSA